MAAALAQWEDEWDGTQQSAEKRQLSEGQRKFSDSDNNTFEIFAWSGIKERRRKVQETKVSHRTKTTSCEGEARPQSMRHEELRRRNLSKLFYGHTRLSVAQPNALNPQCWNKSKRQESNNSYTTKTCRHYFTGYTTTSDHNKPYNLKDCWWDYIYINPQKGQTSHLTRTWRDG